MGIKVDTRQLKAFSEKLETLSTVQKEVFFHQACNQIGAQYLSIVIPATPVGKGSMDGEGHTVGMGGTLRRGWSAKAPTIGGGAGGYTVTVENPVEYASYVEYGHRQTPGRYVPAIGKRLVKSWVDGQFFVKKSEQALKPQISPTLEPLLDAYMRTVF